MDRIHGKDPLMMCKNDGSMNKLRKYDIKSEGTRWTNIEKRREIVRIIEEKKGNWMIHEIINVNDRK